MKNNITEIAFILDRSGSMSGLESDTIGGFNSLITKQTKQEGEGIITTVLFDDEYELLHDRSSLNSVKKLDDSQYFVRGTTALLDAIGKTILKISSAHNSLKEDHRPSKVLFVITTDGMENASCEFDYNKIKNLISQKQELGWEFLFLGANIDSISQGSSMGIKANRSVNFTADSRGVSLNFDVVSSVITAYRETGVIEEEWAEMIEEDYSSR